MRRSAKLVLRLAIAAILVCLASTQFMCRDRGGNAPAGFGSNDASEPDPIVTTTPPTTLPAGPTSVRVSIRMVIHKKYGLLAHVAGNRDSTVVDEAYVEGKSWWDNPMLVFQDASFPNSLVTADDDSATITGRGKSANVTVDLTLVPHADITLKTLAASDCIKGTLTATITTISDYYDRKWTRMADARDTPIAFNFDTSKPNRPLRPTTQESRAMPPFSFERYARDREKWEQQSTWPTTPKSGDWRSTIHVKDAKLTITGYQYADLAPATQPAAAPQSSTKSSTTQP